ncbi:uncharacterized protein LOC124594165 [Schistocerca americana]|uniref:uncharacterized protein LOC124594165 n=1 Tax=Schistocerca americana TaxID=7009 RepID=UPI001F4FB672|nr:uncharacterized protein LOC124594165 [Schistocerca americana]
MDVERLMEEVRKFPVLYDQGSENYRNIEYKDRVWKTIATDLQAKGGIEECKKKWASVRDQLRKTLQKRKTVSGQAAVHQHKYKYEDLLTFLLPYMVERETVSNVPYTQDNNEHKQESNTDSQEEQSIVENEKVSTQEDITDEEWIIKTQDSETENLIERTRHSQTPSAHSSVTSKKNTFMKPPLKRKFQREVKPQESASSQLMAYILAEKKAEKQRDIQNPVDAFLAGIAPALKSLHPLLFHQAKSRIFSIVQDFELKQLMNDVSVHQFTPSSSNSSAKSVSTPYPSPVGNESTEPTQQLLDLQRHLHNSYINNQSHHPPSSPASSSASETNSLNSPHLFFLG